MGGSVALSAGCCRAATELRCVALRSIPRSGGVFVLAQFLTNYLGVG
jgi:hypothetical protein